MNLRECFERIDVEAWATGLGLNRWLYRPSRTDEDRAWVERLLGVLAGSVTYRLIFEEKLRSQAFVEAAELLEFIPEPDRKELKEQLTEHLRDAHEKSAGLVQGLKERVSSLQKRGFFQEIAPMWSEVAGDIAELEKISKPPRDLSVLSIKTYCETFVKKVKDKDEEVRLLEEEITRFEKGVLKKGLGILDSIMSQLKPLVLDGAVESRALVEKCFLALPELVLTGQTDTLEQIRNSLQASDLQKLNDVPLRSRLSVKQASLDEFLGQIQRDDERSVALSDIPFRAITKQF
jgi:hypothetical protein